jgi:hypothetical protein
MYQSLMPDPTPTPCPPTQAPEDLLNGWANNIGKLLGLVEKACQQISKEAMLHKVNLGAGGSGAVPMAS